MSVRLFHKHSRLVIATAPQTDGAVRWYAVHRKPVAWEGIFRPALALVGFEPEPVPGGLRFGAGGIHWTRGPMWTTIRLQLPPCSPKKAALLASGLLKAARYGGQTGADRATRE